MVRNFTGRVIFAPHAIARAEERNLSLTLIEKAVRRGRLKAYEPGAFGEFEGWNVTVRHQGSTSVVGISVHDDLIVVKTAFWRA